MHIPVLLQPTIEKLDLRAGETVLDATLGLGGHAKTICEKIGPTGILVGLDQDSETLEMARQNLETYPAKKILKVGNFRYLTDILQKAGIAQIDAVLFDLGFNSFQMDQSGRGFTFQKDEPLLMTLSGESQSEILTAFEIVNNWSVESLTDIIYGYGEERSAKKIAAAIVAAREEGEIKTTFQLVEIIKKALGVKGKGGRIHPATKTFQALRITVNDELGAFKEGLSGAWDKLALGGRIAVITFHSLEARLVKDFIRAKKEMGKLELLAKMIKPDRKEVLANPRSRSAQLRVFKKIN
ncbi:MAG: 16S rRNA (cytosine(1402)-N(4))-methyltransferase RsmH [Candidatus Paceibacterota bacterium]|jgi:16S rRNA (cytosine1402-N4)-methyltransferase